MARKPTARVVLNRRSVNNVRLAVADGVNAVAKTIIVEGNPPDATPWGAGLVMRGGWLTYVDDKKVAGGGTDGRQPKKPRAFRVRGRDLIQAIAGWGFPARFQQFGTTKQAANPFFTRDRDRIAPRALSIANQAAKYRIVRLLRG